MSESCDFLTAEYWDAMTATPEMIAGYRVGLADGPEGKPPIVDSANEKSRHFRFGWSVGHDKARGVERRHRKFILDAVSADA
jgi:hypothetical protein